MRILLMVLQFPPDVNSTGMLMARLGQSLVQRGHEVSVVTTFPHYAKFRVGDEDRGKLADRAKLDGMDVLRLYVHARGHKQNMVNRLLSYISFNVLALAAMLGSGRTSDVILCTNGGFFSGLTAALVGRVKRMPVVCNIQDLYPETPVATGQLRNPPAIKALTLLEHLTYRVVDHVTVITPSFRTSLLGKGVPVNKITIVPNFVDTAFIRPLPKRNAFSERERLADKFVVTHAGNVGYVYDLDTLLDAAELLRGAKDIVFLIVGDGVTKSHLRERAQRSGLHNVRFMPYQPLSDLPWLRAASDVQLALYRKGSAQHSMPSKVYEIMASGRPLLASAEPGTDVRNLVESANCGVCVDPQDARQLADAVLSLARDEAGRTEMGCRGRELAERSYALEAVADQYENILQRVIAGRDARGAVLQSPQSDRF